MTNIGSLLVDAATLMVTGMAVVFISHHSCLSRSAIVETGARRSTRADRSTKNKYQSSINLFSC